MGVTDITVVTNNVPRPLVSWYELSSTQRRWFDYVSYEDRHSARFVFYKNQWYDTLDTEGRPSHTPALSDWDAFASESIFAGVVFKYTPGLDQVVVGHYYS